jgi:hypothetical protein
MERRKIKRDSMIEKGDKAKGFRFGRDNSAGVIWDEQMMCDYIGVEGTVTKIMEGPRGLGQRIEIRFEKLDFLSGCDQNHHHVKGDYPLAEFLQQIREERIKEIGI